MSGFSQRLILEQGSARSQVSALFASTVARSGLAGPVHRQRKSCANLLVSAKPNGWVNAQDGISESYTKLAGLLAESPNGQFSARLAASNLMA